MGQYPVQYHQRLPPTRRRPHLLDRRKKQAVSHNTAIPPATNYPNTKGPSPQQHVIGLPNRIGNVEAREDEKEERVPDESDRTIRCVGELTEQRRTGVPATPRRGFVSDVETGIG